MNTLSPLTETEAHLRSLGAQSDAGTPNPAPVPDPSETAAPLPAPVTQEEPSAPPSDEGQATAGEEGSESESAASAAAPETDANAPQPVAETPYEKARREGKEREARAWQKIEEEKARLRQERETWEAERAKSASPTPPGPNAPSEAPAPEPEAFQRQWWENVRQELEATPELRDQHSPLGQAVQALLRESRLFSLSPDGFRQAAALARARTEAAALPALKTRIDTLTKENERLVKLTSVTGTPPTRTRDSEDPHPSERDLRRLAAEYDSSTP